MVDVTSKGETLRRAVAAGRVVFPPGVRERVLEGRSGKGAVLSTARIAGIQGAKRTWELIPLCHALPLGKVRIEFNLSRESEIGILCEAVAFARTGVEMEALTGAAIAALTVYDMAKALDKGIRIEGVQLLEKSGGKSGDWRAPDPEG